MSNAMLSYERQNRSWEAPTREQGKEKSICPSASAPESELESHLGVVLASTPMKAVDWLERIQKSTA